jgi:hypothetical protein
MAPHKFEPRTSLQDFSSKSVPKHRRILKEYTGVVLIELMRGNEPKSWSSPTSSNATPCGITYTMKRRKEGNCESYSIPGNSARVDYESKGAKF